MGWPRMTGLERAIAQVALVGLAAAITVGAVVGLIVDRLVQRADR